MPTVLSLSDLEKARTGQVFLSKKNRVFRSLADGKPCIVKVYRGEWRERAAVEYKVLQDCHAKGVPVPEPIALMDGAVVMAVVEGEVAGDAFDRLMAPPSRSGLTSELERLADALSRWLALFHSQFGFEVLRGDTILRNFICGDRGLVGLDFEETTRGDPLADLGQLCASALMTDPAFTEPKVSFAGRLAERYWACSGQRREGELPGAVSKAIRYYSQFRPNGPNLQSFASRIERGEVKI